MLCKNPYVKTQTGITRMHCIVSKDARTATTPFPCGRCLHCKINKAREWTNRIMLENMVSADSAFITLTYDDDHLPSDGSLQPHHLRNFIQNLRRHNEGNKIRYFAVGEYGDKSWRPHYHLIVFGSDRLRRESSCKRRADNVEYAWKKGYTQVGDVSKDSARYCTGYVTKKVTRPYYENLGDRQPEFMRCSKNNGGIGYGAIKVIAKQLKSNKFFKPRVIREIKCGTKVLPLGRYLTEKLSTEIGVTEACKSSDLYEYQFGLIDKYIDNENFLGALLSDNDSKRNSREKRYKIYSKRKTL